MVERQTAVKVNIAAILGAEYFVESGWTPNYLLLDSKKVSRVNVIGVIVVDLPEEPSNKSFILDDGTGKISMRFFEKEKSDKLSVGSTVLVIGRIRIFNNERFLLPEIVRTLDNPGWIELRKREVGITSDPAIFEEEIIESPEQVDAIAIIKELDNGTGVDTEKIISQLGDSGEKIIGSLMTNGEIFEVSPGRIKVLE